MNRRNIQRIVDSLEDVLEQLLSLPDDMLLQIDPRDNESLRKGVEFIAGYNDELDLFSQVTAKLKSRLEAHFEFNAETDGMESASVPPDSSGSARSVRDRIIAELDQTTPHTLDENFTYTRPYGFVMGEVAYKGIKTWKSLYMTVLGELSKVHPDAFLTFPTTDRFVSKRGNFSFSADPSKLRLGERLPGFDFYVEVNLSAESISDNMKAVLEYLGLPRSSITIYLREDRDAG